MIKHYKGGCLAASPKLPLIFFICILMAHGQDASSACHSMNIGDYAKLSYCISPQISLTPGSWAEENYSQGEDIAAGLLLNGSKVDLHLLYPCVIKGGLTPSELRSEAIAFDPEMAQASYNMTPINISGAKALWGNLDNITFAVFQPTNKTVAIVLFDKGIPLQLAKEFSTSLKIAAGSKSPQKYCAQIGVEPIPVENAGRFGIFNNSASKEFGTDLEAMITGQEISQEALAADREAREGAD